MYCSTYHYLLCCKKCSFIFKLTIILSYMTSIYITIFDTLTIITQIKICFITCHDQIPYIFSYCKILATRCYKHVANISCIKTNLKNEKIFCLNQSTTGISMYVSIYTYMSCGPIRYREFTTI